MWNQALTRENLIFLTNGSNRWAVFVSGQGSNLRALCQGPHLAKIALVVSSSPQANALLFARRYGLLTLVLPKPIDWQGLHQKLINDRIDRIFLLGFMRIIPKFFVDLWAGKILNLHPSLLPKYPGLGSIQQAYNAKDSVGVTVHEVTAEIDAGPHIVQRIAVDKKQVLSLTLEDTEFLTHQCEQKVVWESVRKWTRARM